MGGLASLGLLLLAPAAPIPSPAAAAEGRIDRNQALLFAGRVVNLAHQLADEYVRPVEPKDLIEAALRGLYEEAGLACPDEVRQAVRRARSTSDFAEAVAAARMALGDAAALDGPRALFAAINGFRHATDPYTVLVGPQATTFVSVEMDCGIGLELDGVQRARWTLYQLELGYATGRYPSDPAIGRVRMPAPPVAFPWRVRRVIAGSPCQRAGFLPGDVVTHLDGRPVTAESSAALFRELAAGPFVPDALAGRGPRGQRAFRLRREGRVEPLALGVTAEPYVPEAVFGVRRVSDEQWDHVLDREYGIGYVRLGAFERKADERLSLVLAALARRTRGR